MSDFVIQGTYDNWNRPVERMLPDDSQIHYKYEGPFLRKILRKGIYHGYFYNSEYEYAHRYDQYNAKGLVLEETGAFTSRYAYDKEGRCIHQQSPYFEEDLGYDLAGNLISKGGSRFTYDAASQLTSEEGKFYVGYDQHYNRTSENGKELQVDSLNQRRDTEYDLNGNLIRPGFVSDEFDQLIQTGRDHFTYCIGFS